MGECVKWFVRGVPEDMTRAVTAAAKQRGVTVGRLVTDALREHLETQQRGDALATGSSPFQSELEGLQQRVAALEACLKPNHVPKQKSAATLKPRLPQGEKERIDTLLRAGVAVRDILQIVPGARQSTVYRRYEVLRHRGLA